MWLGADIAKHMLGAGIIGAVVLQSHHVTLPVTAHIAKKTQFRWHMPGTNCLFDEGQRSEGASKAKPLL